MLQAASDTMSTPATGTVVRPRATVTIPAMRRGPVCARRGCHYSAWFAIHHVPVCSSQCAEALSVDATTARPPVVRAVRWTPTGTVPWTLVIASAGREHDWLNAWWWAGRGSGGVREAGHTCSYRVRNVDILTDAGLFAFLRRLVRQGATELRPWRIAAWAWERGESAPPWVDITLPQEPTALARALVRAANARTRRRERQRALRARYRQRGTSHDGTTDQAARVA